MLEDTKFGQCSYLGSLPLLWTQLMCRMDCTLSLTLCIYFFLRPERRVHALVGTRRVHQKLWRGYQTRSENMYEPETLAEWC